MGRPQRFHRAGLLIHVTIRCNNQEFLLFQSDHFKTLLDYMGEMVTQGNIILYDYALMSNHSHWLLSQAADVPLSDSLQWVFGGFAKWYNRRHNRRGHFWGRRYRRTIIEQDEHALICMRYIARNPVRARLVYKPMDYAWSGYRHYAGGDSNPLLDFHPSYLGLGRFPKERVTRYRRLVEDQISPESDTRNKRISGAAVFGSQDFIYKIKRDMGVI